MRKMGRPEESRAKGINEPKGKPGCLRDSVDRVATEASDRRVRTRSAWLGSGNCGSAGPVDACVRAFQERAAPATSRRLEAGEVRTLDNVFKTVGATIAAANFKNTKQKLPPISSNLKLYCARHTFATDMLAEGMNLAEVKELRGHEDVKTTMKYLHPNTSGAAAVVSRRNRYKSLHLLKATG
jgi:hypothetical protein